MIRLIIGILLGAVMVIFAVQNTETVTFRFLPWAITMNRAVLVIGVFVIGGFFGWLIGSIGRAKRARAKK